MRLPPELTYNFWGIFARCEYALKSSGFERAKAGSVEADWDKFATAVDWHFRRLVDPQFKEAVDFILLEPPRKQIFRNGHLQWEESNPDPKQPKAQQVLLMVRRVRNNLFHGAKIWSPEYDNRVRDIRLVESSILILENVMRLNQEVRLAYDIGVF